MIIQFKKTAKIIISAIVFGIVFAGVGYLIIHNINHIDKNTYKNNENKVNYLNINGLNVDETPFIEEEVTVPEKWNKVYEDYNEVQRRQGYNLSDYKGKKVIRNVYEVKNYNDGEKNIYAEVLTYNDKIIASSIFEMTQDGFIRSVE
ncbi:MAG: DUF4830 domain-containing protein [Ruminococcus sp.]|jgi:hypothetical protein|nr:DUF4830 domain-containing protein [Ruminococcus sp.]